MAITLPTQSSIIIVTDVEIELDTSGNADFAATDNIQCAVTALAFSSGDIAINSLNALCGDVFVVGQNRNPRVLDMTGIYNDPGGVTDTLFQKLYDIFKDDSTTTKQNIGVRIHYKGDASTFDYIDMIGFLNQVLPPGLPEGTFTFQLTGDDSLGTTV